MPQRHEDREQDENGEGDDEELEWRHRDVDEPRRARGGDDRAHHAEHYHHDREAGAGQAQPAVDVHASRRHQRRLCEQQQEPGGVGDAVHVEDGLRRAVHACPLGVPWPEEERPREAEHDRRGERCGETDVHRSLGRPGRSRADGGGAISDTDRGLAQRLAHGRSRGGGWRRMPVWWIAGEYAGRFPERPAAISPARAARATSRICAGSGGGGTTEKVPRSLRSLGMRYDWIFVAGGRLGILYVDGHWGGNGLSIRRHCARRS